MLILKLSINDVVEKQKSVELKVTNMKSYNIEHKR